MRNAVEVIFERLADQQFIHEPRNCQKSCLWHILLIRSSFYFDGRYANGDMFKWFNIVLGNIKNALHGSYHAIGQNFAIDSMIEQLASVALTTSPISQRLQAG